jgi:hypothetical protein
MRKVGIYRDYEQLLTSYQKLPLVNSPSLDLTSYVTDRTLGDEETRIREDPAARTTALLQQVFAQ